MPKYMLDIGLLATSSYLPILQIKLTASMHENTKNMISEMVELVRKYKLELISPEGEFVFPQVKEEKGVCVYAIFNTHKEAMAFIQKLNTEYG